MQQKCLPHYIQMQKGYASTTYKHLTWQKLQKHIAEAQNRKKINLKETYLLHCIYKPSLGHKLIVQCLGFVQLLLHSLWFSSNRFCKNFSGSWFSFTQPCSSLVQGITVLALASPDTRQPIWQSISTGEQISILCRNCRHFITYNRILWRFNVRQPLRKACSKFIQVCKIFLQQKWKVSYNSQLHTNFQSCNYRKQWFKWNMHTSHG